MNKAKKREQHTISMPIKDWLFFPHILLQLNPNNSQGEPREDKQGSNRPFLPRSMVFFIPTIKD